MMRINLRNILAVLVTVLLFTGCGKDFLEGPEVQKDPNRATEISADQLFNGIQVKTYYQQEAEMSRLLSIWMQYLSGTDRQTSIIGEYVHTEETLGDELEEVYIEGGLVDIEELVKVTEAAGNRVYAGIAKFFEAFVIGMASSLWGDLPYSEAISDVATPRLDSMSEIYTAVQNLLDEAIQDLQSGELGTTLASSPQNDVNFNADANKWIAACYSLKARFYMHWAEVDAGNYTSAMNAARQGIDSYTNNFVTYHSAELNKESIYYLYQKNRDSYLRANQTIVELLKSRNDPRLALYFDPDADGEFVGSEQGDSNVEASMLSADEYLRQDRSFDLLTWEETQLIIAECAYQAGDEATALATLNQVRRGIEERWGFQAGSLGTAENLSGEALLDKIMEDKYIALFLNMETYNDWKRTKRPVFTPTGGGNPEIKIPHRVYYSEDMRNTNPNIPETSQQPLRNANDPN
ncbi:SusD/RagB family nutrient-binding outer membrane lipoprotein [candidate division KSB1 bacterium]|nr:SusD/RagB family nutrient-binding outer membrane lipoprotein [candidate division KSB1 bacterium]